jgi:hemerythrin-like metal-binding protein
MPKIEWDEAFSVNNEEVDSQHKKWLSIINDLHDSMMKGDISMSATLNTMKSMKEYVKYHFDFEEEYMRKINYPDAEQHKRIHDKFYVMVNEYYNNMHSGKLVLNGEIMNMLMNWFKDHILHEDKKYSESAK